MRMTTQETHSVIASDRVEGTPVRSTNGTRIGMIERVMIDKLTGNVVYVVLNLDGLVGKGQKRLPISWARLTYDRKLGDYHLDHGTIMPTILGYRGTLVSSAGLTGCLDEEVLPC